uniref:hypothetical protein n=1 Tax=Xenorhabdus doucetiae TaxID=351671 RepID=UPI0038CD2C72
MGQKRCFLQLCQPILGGSGIVFFSRAHHPHQLAIKTFHELFLQSGWHVSRTLCR